MSEDRIGRVLEDVRANVVFATKSSCRSKEGVLGELETSLQNLRTDWIDGYQLRNVSSREAWNAARASYGALDVLYEGRDVGMFRHVGIS